MQKTGKQRLRSYGTAAQAVVDVKNKKRRKGTYWRWLRKACRVMRMELREHKPSYRVYFVLQILVALLFIFQLAVGNYESAFLCALTWVLLLVPSMVQVTFRIELPIVLEIIILLFIFAAEILGEIYAFYIIFPFWDTVLHVMNGFLSAAIGFSFVNLLNKSDELIFHVSPFFSAIVAFSFSMTIGAVWEIFEFSMDQLFLFDMQKDTWINRISTVTLDPLGENHPVVLQDIEGVVIDGEPLPEKGYLDIGLIDTMCDLIVNLLGAAVFSIIGFFYTKKQGRQSIAKKFIPIQKTEDKDYWNMTKE